jgi:hypothetical protein
MHKLAAVNIYFVFNALTARGVKEKRGKRKAAEPERGEATFLFYLFSFLLFRVEGLSRPSTR